jgi:hypothetical protein
VIGHNLKSNPDLHGRESEPAFLYCFHVFTCHDRIYKLKTKYLSEYPNSKPKFEIIGHSKIATRMFATFSSYLNYRIIFDTAVFRNVIPCSIVNCMPFSKGYATAIVSVIRYDKGESSLPSNS